MHSLVTLFLIESVFLALLSRIRPFRAWFRSFFGNRYFLYFILPILFLFGYPLSQGFTYVEGASLGWHRVARVVLFLGAGLVFGAALVRMGRFRLPPFAAYKIFFLYILIAFLSFIYSPDKDQTIWKSYELLVLLMGSAFLYFSFVRKKRDPEPLMMGLMYAVFALCVLALMGGILAPGAAWKNHSELRGVVPMINSNQLGQLGGILAAYGLISVMGGKRNKLGSWVALVVGISALLGAFARTSLIGFAIFVIAILIYHRGIWTGGLISLLLILPTLMIREVIFSHFLQGQSEESFRSLSGRTLVWEKALNVWRDNPIFGTGYYSGHKHLEDELGRLYATLDSTYVETLVDLGLVGLIVLVSFMISVIFLYIKTYGRLKGKVSHGFIMAGVFLWFIIIRSFTASTYQVLHYNLLFLLIVVSYISIKYKLSTHHKSVFQIRKKEA